MKLVVDMNLSPRWAGLLVAAGFDAVHWSTIGPANASDRVILEHARENGQVVLTHDLDFSTMLAVSGGMKPSVVQIRAEDVSPDAIAGVVIAALRQVNAELDEGALLTIEAQRSRLRLLPLR